MTESKTTPAAQAGWVVLVAEGVGSFLVVALIAFAVWFAERWSGQVILFQSAAYSLEIGLGLWGLFLLMGPRVRSYFNPAIALAQGILGDMPWRRSLAVSAAQVAGALTATLVLSRAATPDRLSAIVPVSSQALFVREFIATFGLVLLYAGTRRLGWRASGAFLAACSAVVYWLPGATYFANPALVSASMVRFWPPGELGVVLASQLAAVAIAGALSRWLFAATSRST